MKDHIKTCMEKKSLDRKVFKLECTISEQKLQVTKAIFDLKEEEVDERIRCKQE